MNEKATKNRFDSNVSPWKQIIKVAMPIFLLSLSNVSYSFIDTLLAIGLINDPNYSASRIMGLTFPIVVLSLSIITIILVGFSMYLPKVLGKDRFDDAKNLVIHTFVYGLIFCVFIILILFFISPVWMNWLGSLGSSPLTQDEVDGGILYIRISSLVFLIIVFRDIIVRVLRSEDKGFQASIIPMVALPINLFFDWVFMGPLEMKLGGAALASLIGALIGLMTAYFYSFTLIKDDKTIINFEFSRFHFETKYIKKLTFYGINNYIRALTLILFTIFLTFFTIQLSGTDGTTDYWKEYVTLSARLLSITSIFAYAFVQASIMLFVFNKGKKNYQRAKNFLKLGILYSMLSSIFMLMILIPLVNPFLKLFQINDPLGNDIYRNAFYIRFLTAPLFLIQYIYVSFFAITKNMKESLISSIVGNIFIGITTLIIFYNFVYLPTDNTSFFFLGLLVIGLLQLILLTPMFWKKYNEV